jgi:hypothetical protein
MTLKTCKTLSRGKTPEFVEQCNPADKSLKGEIVLLKTTPHASRFRGCSGQFQTGG